MPSCFSYPMPLFDTYLCCPSLATSIVLDLCTRLTTDSNTHTFLFVCFLSFIYHHRTCTKLLYLQFHFLSIVPCLSIPVLCNDVSLLYFVCLFIFLVVVVVVIILVFICNINIHVKINQVYLFCIYVVISVLLFF